MPCLHPTACLCHLNKREMLEKPGQALCSQEHARTVHQSACIEIGSRSSSAHCSTRQARHASARQRPFVLRSSLP